jgi:HlyD family type I secretion membrane fusion protein
MKYDNTRMSPASGVRSLGMGTRILAGSLLAVCLVAGAGGWAATANLAGAVITRGSVVVDQELKSIQHRDGGIVQEIAVREGDAVREDQVLIRLDDAQTRAELSIIDRQITELSIRRARLLAERDGLATIEFPKNVGGSESEMALLVLGETRLFEGNRTQRESQKQQLELSIQQIGDEILGLHAQRAAKRDEIGLIEDEFDKLSTLVEKGLVEGSRLSSVKRELARLLGESGSIDAELARAEGRISEIRLQIIGIDEDDRTEAQRELSTVAARLSEFQDRKMAIEDRLVRTEIRAPISGTVNELSVHTVGGVITPAEVLVTIVPQDAKLKIEAQLFPTSIDQVAEGQSVRLRFTSFNHRTTPELMGHISHVSPATTRDSVTGERYFLADVEVSEGELAKLPSHRLLPGMEVEVFVQTEHRTALSYLVKPISDQFNRAFRER